MLCFSRYCGSQRVHTSASCAAASAALRMGTTAPPGLIAVQPQLGENGGAPGPSGQVHYSHAAVAHYEERLEPSSVRPRSVSAHGEACNRSADLCACPTRFDVMAIQNMHASTCRRSYKHGATQHTQRSGTRRSRQLSTRPWRGSRQTATRPWSAMSARRPASQRSMSIFAQFTLHAWAPPCQTFQKQQKWQSAPRYTSGKCTGCIL